MFDVCDALFPAAMLWLLCNLGSGTYGLFDMGLRLVCQLETTLVACHAQQSATNAAISRSVRKHISGVYPMQPSDDSMCQPVSNKYEMQFET